MEKIRRYSNSIKYSFTITRNSEDLVFRLNTSDDFKTQKFQLIITPSVAEKYFKKHFKTTD